MLPFLVSFNIWFMLQIDLLTDSRLVDCILRLRLISPYLALHQLISMVLILGGNPLFRMTMFVSMRMPVLMPILILFDPMLMNNPTFHENLL